MSEPKIVPSTAARVARFEVNSAVTPIRLSEHFSVVKQYRILVASVTVSVSLGGAIYAYSKPPIYEGNLLVSVPDVRAAEQRNLLGSPALNPETKTSMSESEMLRSRMVLGPVVDKLHLDIEASPLYPTMIGRAIANWNGGYFSLVNFLGGFSWGSEKIVVGEFNVPPALLGMPFRIMKLGRYKFRLQDESGLVNGTGRIGSLSSFRTSEGMIDVIVERLVGQPSSGFILKKLPRQVALENLRSALTISELGKDSGMLSVIFDDKSPRNVESVLNEIGNTYLDLIQIQKTRDVDHSLALLQAQLPELRTRLDDAEARYEGLRQASNTTDFVEETKLKLARSYASKAQLSELRQKRAELSARLGGQHPLIVALDQQIYEAEQDEKIVLSELKKVPSLSKELDRRSRNLQNETEIYNSVERKIEELSVIARDKSSNVHVIDNAFAPLVPKSSRFVTIGFFLLIGFLLGIFSAFLRRMLADSAGS